ncbi:MAG: TonB-dependent receptor [Acidobacteriia bacterium]|nr:TonB-dependent receptor [Terriglobia bacterium]
MAVSTVVAMILLFLFASCPLLAQIPTGTILGAVKDQSGASIFNATVTMKNEESNLTRTAMTGEDGTYRFSGLPVGRYTARVEITGFKGQAQTGITLDIAQAAAINFTLQVGSSQEEITVMGEAPQIDVSGSTLAHLVDQDQIAQLPLNGRNFIDLSLMQPGITQYSRFTTAQGFAGTWYSSNGAPMRSNMYMLDGAIMGGVVGATASSVTGTSLGVDGIQEYKVMTNSFSAEYGLTMGSQMTIATKSGTNTFHGDIFEYFRNSVLDARNFFDVLNQLPSTVPGGGRRVAPFQRNQFGGSVGGPIRKNKTFFFTTFEGYRDYLSNPSYIGVANVPAAACHGSAGTVVWNGQGTQPAGSIGPCSQLGSNPGGAGTNSVTISPVMAPFLAEFPNPNTASSTKQPQFGYLSKQQVNENYGQMRIDHNFSANDSLFGRYTIDDADENRPFSLPQWTDHWVEREQYLTLAENHIFSQSLLNSARISFSRVTVHTHSTNSAGYNVAPYILTPLNINDVQQGQVAYSGGTPLVGEGGGGGFLTNIQNVYSFGDDLFWTKGKHSLKFGTLINHYIQDADNESRVYSNVAFAGLAQFMTGKFQTYFVYAPSFTGQQQYMLYNTAGFYIQDDYRVLPRLTLNLGLRYEFATTPNEKDGRQGHFDNPPFDNTPVVGPLLGNPTLHDFGPRVGFAWDVFGNGKTSVRGGASLLYDIATLGEVFVNSGAGTPPFSVFYTVTNPTNAPLQPLPLIIPATACTTATQAATSPSTCLQGTTPLISNYNYRSPRMVDLNLAIQRQLPFGMALSVVYAGSRGTHLWSYTEANPRCPVSNPFLPAGCSATVTLSDGTTVPFTIGPTAWSSKVNPATNAGVTTPRLNPFWGNITENNTVGVSWYNALQVDLAKRISHGLEFHSAYTWAKALDDSQGFLGQENSASPLNVQNPFSPISDWARASFDVKQNWRFSLLYHFPTIQAEGLKSKLVNGWWMGNIVSVQTGYPFSPVLGTDREQSGIGGAASGIDRPDYVTSANLAAVKANGQPNAVVYDPNAVITGNPGQWFNANMFTLPAVGSPGNVGRNSLTGPGLATWDMSLNKDTRAKFLGESGMVQFRAEVFNLMNHANFGIVSQTAFTGSVATAAQSPSSTAGSITTTSTDPREIQFSLKILF